MTKLFAILTVATALVASVQGQGCPANARLCGYELIDDYQCKPWESTRESVLRLSNTRFGTGSNAEDLIFLTPQNNKIRDCIFPTDGAGQPFARGVACCAVGRCFASGVSAFCG